MQNIDKNLKEQSDKKLPSLRGVQTTKQSILDKIFTGLPRSFHSVLNLLHAHRVSPKLLRNRRLNQFAIRINSLSLNHPSAIPLSHRERVKRQAAFTLAEVLITLGIIGVVAALTLPAIIANIQERVKTERVQNIKQKFSKATDKMLSVSSMNGYDSTATFVNELQHHLKIAKICDNSNIRECWPTDKVIINEEGKEWDISQTKTYRALQMSNRNGNEWDNTVGIITADGTAMILSYDKKCDIDSSKPTTWKGGASSSASCVAAVFDWNGAKKPNKLDKDVIRFNANGLGDCAVSVGGACLGTPQFVAEPLNVNECNELKGQLGIQDCTRNNDYYAAAAKNCGGVQNMASLSDLFKLASYIYGKNITSPFHNGVLNPKAPEVQSRLTALGLPTDSTFHIFGNTETNSGRDAYYFIFGNDGENSGWVNYHFFQGRLSSKYVVCKY